MRQQPQRKVQYRTREHVARAEIDPKNGRIVMRVPIQGRPGIFAQVYADDYERVCAKNERRWFLRKSGVGRLEYVTVKHWRRGKNDQPTNHALVVWIILDLWQRDGMEVTYIDGDRLNLRRDNLEVRSRENNPRVKTARARKRSQSVDGGATSPGTK